ncbi:intercellular trafficking and secretion [Ascosphaera acerosa]|nr:intercellular trafficking and secretion [Ascosphaera acerosa]
MSANDYDSVSWRNGADGDGDGGHENGDSRPGTSESDLAGMNPVTAGDARGVSAQEPLHENDPPFYTTDDAIAGSAVPPRAAAGDVLNGTGSQQHDARSTSRIGPALDDGVLECTVDAPLKENDGTKDAYISYLVTTHVSDRPAAVRTTLLVTNVGSGALKTNFKTFARSNFCVRRRFQDFYFLYKSLFRDYPQCAIPPLPDKQRMEYVRGDRFGKEFTQRRAWSLHRFVKRLTLHPILRRAPILAVFLESPDWNAYMRTQSGRATGATSAGTAAAATPAPGSFSSPSTTADSGGPTGIFDNFTETFVNAFSKVSRPDRRFLEVRARADKLDEDLSHVEKTTVRVVRRETDLEADYAELAAQFRRLVLLEPEIEVPLQVFAASVEETARGCRALRDHSDLNYLTSLRDMSAYVASVRLLLKTREQKQLDFEALLEYRNKALADREAALAAQHGNAGAGIGRSGPSSTAAAASGVAAAAAPVSSYYSSATTSLGMSFTSPASFLRSKMEDMRGVDHESARRERLRKLEMKIDELTREVDSARLISEGFDEEVVREVADFERIRAAEFRDTLGALAQRHIDFYQGVLNTWERFILEMEAENETVVQRGETETGKSPATEVAGVDSGGD